LDAKVVVKRHRAAPGEKRKDFCCVCYWVWGGPGWPGGIACYGSCCH
jgi:hypothetical protein